MTKGKPVIGRSSDEVLYFPSATQAAKAMGGNHSLVSRACLNGTEYKGFRWEYTEPIKEWKDPTVKRCSRCGEIKPLSEFNRKKSEPDGLKRWCKKCSAESLKTYRMGRRCVCPACGRRPITSDTGFCKPCARELSCGI